MKYTLSLHTADYLSLTALGFGWIAILLIVANHPFGALYAQLTAFIFDLVDGMVARKNNQPTAFGRQLDSAVDFLVYCVVSALLVNEFIAPHPFVGAVGGFSILLFGVLRLLRFNQEGMQTSAGKPYYRGVTVVHLNVLVILAFLVVKLIPALSVKVFASILITAVSPLMLSSFKSYKPQGYWGIGVAFLILLTLLTMVAYGAV